MDFSYFSTTRLEARTIPYEGLNIGEITYENNYDKEKPRRQTGKEVFDAILSSVDTDTSELSDNLINANVCFSELSALSRKDLEFMGCKDENQQTSLLEFFRILPRQDRSYAEILQSQEAQMFNETILKRTSSHLGSMKSALNAANYKLKIVAPEDVVVNEKNFASRFVLDALEELQRVTDEIDAQLDALVKESRPKSNKKRAGREGIALKFSILLSAALGTWLGFLIWKTVKSK